MALYFQIVNNTGSAENSFLYNSKVIQLTVNGRSFPKRTLKTIYYCWFIQWADILPCTLTAIAPATFTCHFFPMSRDGVQNVCVMHDRYSTLPPSPAFATLYQHSPTRLILRGSPTRSRTLGTGFMDPTNPITTLQIVKETHTLKNAIQHDIFTSEWSLQMVPLLGVTSRTYKPCQYRGYPFLRGCCDRLS